MAPIIQQNLQRIDELCRLYGLQKLFVFGSAARGNDFNEASDVDFLYQLKPEIGEKSLDNRPDFFEMSFSFEDLLGRN